MYKSKNQLIEVNSCRYLHSDLVGTYTVCMHSVFHNEPFSRPLTGTRYQVMTAPINWNKVPIKEWLRPFSIDFGLCYPQILEQELRANNRQHHN